MSLFADGMYKSKFNPKILSYRSTDFFSVSGSLEAGSDDSHSLSYPFF